MNSATIPAAFIGFDDGASIRAYLLSNARATVLISTNFAPFNITTFDQVAPFSSHGPATGSGALKPDVTAVGVDLYLAGQTYDPNGNLYSASGYLVSQGTSFSAPQVAGVAALVKQAYPAFNAEQIKAAVVTTATRNLTESGSTASALAQGAGKVNGAYAVQNTLSVTPSSASFGILKTGSLPITQQLQLTNFGSAPLTLSIAPVHLTAELTAHTTVDRPNLTLAPAQSASVNISLTGSLPAPGIYEGYLNIQGAIVPVNIPYLYIVGDGIPNDLISLAGNGDDGTAGQQSAGGYVIVQAIDRYGVGVPNLPVNFSVTSGGGQLQALAAATDNYGIGAAAMILGPAAGANVYTASAGGLSATFQATGFAQPSILAGGIVSAANYSSQAPAPGSYVAIFGQNLAAATTTYSTPYLPLALSQVSVSFDNANVSVPGHIVFVSPGQVNVQIPWELQGQLSVQVKVSVGDSSGTVFTLPLGSYSPALFEIPSGSRNIAASLDENNKIVTVSNPVARGHVVQLFLNGLGPVTNQPASGDPAPASPLARTTSTPIVTIGNQTAQVQFSGMTPGNAALYQINAVVPAGAAAGVEPISVSIGGITSASSSLPIQ
ncbi:MAG: S8 family serine peptidase [Acidobacteriota bacterium]|nr:S8 family serine peptidase [Acidobacteriota bacterium]